MKRNFSYYDVLEKSFITFLVLLSSSASLAQNPSYCQRIIQEAEQLEKLKNFEVERYETLTEIIEDKRKLLRANNLNPNLNSFLPLPPFNERRRKYQDDRDCKLRCPEWGDKDWGKAKDIREVNLDKYNFFNEMLVEELLRLDHIIQGISHANVPEETEPAPKKRTSTVSNAVPSVSKSEPENKHLPQSLDLVKRETYGGRTYRYCMLDPHQADVRVMYRKNLSTPYGFDILEKQIEKQGNRLVMAMNAGMYESDRHPVGLLVSQGQLITPLNVKKGKGNFYMEPNGVFGIKKDGTAFIFTTKSYANHRIISSQLLLATQSGPIMLLGGKINPLFNQNSKNWHFRNVVGVRKDGKVVFAISDQQVSFYEFSAFLLELGCVDALYLDGMVSRMYVPFLHSNQDLMDSGHLGPILYIVE